MAEARQLSDGSDGSGAKEARISSFEAIRPVRSSLSSTRALDANAPLILDEANAFKHTAYNFSTKKKWAVLTVVALCQTSMSKLNMKVIYFTRLIQAKITTRPCTPTRSAASTWSTILVTTISPTPEPEWLGF